MGIARRALEATALNVTVAVAYHTLVLAVRAVEAWRGVRRVPPGQQRAAVRYFRT